MSQLNETEFINNVLTYLGQGMVVSETDSRAVVRAINSTLPSARRAALSEHLWRFAIVRVELGPEAGAPDFGYSHKFRLPADCVRPIGLYDPDEPPENYHTAVAPWKVEGPSILANMTKFPLFYVRDVPEVGAWHSQFFEALVLKVAMKNAYYATGRTDIVNSVLMPQYSDRISMAKKVNAIIGQPEIIRDDGYIRSMQNYPAGYGRRGESWVGQ